MPRLRRVGWMRGRFIVSVYDDLPWSEAVLGIQPGRIVGIMYTHTQYLLLATVGRRHLTLHGVRTRPDVARVRRDRISKTQ